MPLSGAVDFLEHGVVRATTVVGAGPFELTYEFLDRLMKITPRQLTFDDIERLDR
jgi:hypothetical protein